MESNITHKNTYDPSWFAPLLAIEDQHFWFRARTKAIITLAKQAIHDCRSGCIILEVGCGTGNVLRALELIGMEGLVVGIDLFIQGLYAARQRTPAPVIQADIHALPFRSNIHLIGLFDVLEHMTDDIQILRYLYDQLVPGGRLLLTVPAHQWLWSYFDEASHHKRRYELSNLSDRLQSAGFHVEYISEYMASLLPLFVIKRRLIGISQDDKRNQSGLNDVVFKRA